MCIEKDFAVHKSLVEAPSLTDALCGIAGITGYIMVCATGEQHSTPLRRLVDLAIFPT
jgi:hypothetical protein